MAISLNRTGEFLLIFIIVGGVIGASALFLMTPKPHTRPTPQVIMIIRDEGIDQSQSLQIQYHKKPSNAAYLEQTINGIQVEKEWVHNPSKNPRDYHASMDGKRSKNGVFTLPDGTTTIGPRLSGFAKHDVSCRCSIKIVVDAP